MGRFYYLLLLALFYTVFAEHKEHHHHHGENEERIEDGAPVHRKGHEDQSHGEFDHESILGSQKLAEEFHHLTPEESKKRLTIIAKKMDVDSDGLVTLEELKVWVLNSFKELSKEEAMEKLMELDDDNDGNVTWQEYMTETYGQFNKDGKLPNSVEYAEEQKMVSEDFALFKVADQNGDMILNKEEFLFFSHPEEHPFMHEVLYERTMIERDANKDGLITFKEFLSHDVSEDDNLESKEWYLTEKDRFENEFDLSKDGFLDKEETLNWIAPNDSEAAESEAEHLIEETDDSKDGMLSIEEIVSHYDVFVGSEITDYGRHLRKVGKEKDEL